MQLDSSTIVNLLSAIAALSAVILAVLSELRAQKRFKQSNDIQEKIAAANVKPLLIIGQHIANYGRKVTLSNDGIGTAVMRNVTFTKENRSGNSLPSILNMGRKFQWDSYREFTTPPTYLRAGDNIELLALSHAALMSQGFNEGEIQEIIKSLDSEIIGTNISIESEDILRNKQPNYVITLD